MHEGHRKRMYEKLKNGDGLYDHELLEIFLFNAYPRTNTNPIAHDLLSAFGSFQGVFDADVEKLVTVNGVGENVALYIKCVGEILSRMGGSSGAVVVKNFSDFKNFAARRLRGQTEEIFEMYFLDKNGKVIYTYTHSTGNLHRVDINPEKLSGMMAGLKPYGIFVAHNHLGGDSNPSVNDNEFTRSLLLMCRLNNVKLYDHVIYATDKDIYSYYLSGKLDALSRSLADI